MATYVEYQMRDNRWSELKPQVEQHDRGKSHTLMLDTYMRMLAEYWPSIAASWTAASAGSTGTTTS